MPLAQVQLGPGRGLFQKAQFNLICNLTATPCCNRYICYKKGGSHNPRPF